MKLKLLHTQWNVNVQALVHLTTAKQGGECCNQCTVPIYYQSSTSRLWQDLSDPNITVVTQRGPLIHVQ